MTTSRQHSLSLRDKGLLKALANDFAAGRYSDVVTGVRPLLRRYPSFAPALKLLGSALLAQERFLEATSALRAAVEGAPEDAQAFSNLGNALAGAEQFAAAQFAHQEAIRLQPGNPTFRHNLGCLFLQQQKKAEAVEHFLRAYDCDPTDRELAELCRQLLLELEDRAALEKFCRLSLCHIKDDGRLWCSLGSLLLLDPLGDKVEAETALQQAVRLTPDNAVAWSNLSVALHRLTKLAEAIRAGQMAVKLAPDWASAHNNLGVALRDAGAWKEAKIAYLQALSHDAQDADAYYNLGCICIDMGESETAREAYIEALKLSPKLGWVVQGAHACRHVADWDGAELLEGEMERQVAESGLTADSGYHASPFAYLTTPGTTASQQLSMARHYSTQFADRLALPGGALPRNDKYLRIGLLSSDFCDHATAHLMTGVLEALDAKRFRLIAYDYSAPSEDVYRNRLQQVIVDWRQIASISDFDVAQRMRCDGVDIVIDLKGWTQGGRGGILAYRPAPLQMQWLGFPGTMGAPWLDYIIADPIVIPVGAENGYSEKILRLPACYQPNDVQRVIGPCPPRSMLGLPERAFVMAAFHQHYKITRDTCALWLRLLIQIPDAVLWLLDGPPTVKERLVGAANEAGVDPSRLIWAPRMPSHEHLGRFSAADLALDVFPVNAHTTASDALWAGVPQVAHCGETFVSRVSASIVAAAHLPELITDNEPDYEKLILQLAYNRQCLLALRQRLAAGRQQCPLFNTQVFARHLAIGLEMAWARNSAGLAPADINV